MFSVFEFTFIIFDFTETKTPASEFSKSSVPNVLDV